MSELSDENAGHVVRIAHDPDSHDYDCHDDCTAEVVCLGLTNACRTWWECDRCRKVLARMRDEDMAEEYDERLYERGSAHGVPHERIDGMWMTPSDQCLSTACDEHNAHDLVRDFADGDHPVDLDWEEGYLTVRPLSTRPAEPRVHNHPPYRPTCNERTVDGHLRGACLNDDGSER